jgi:signal transduction histidine kinase
MKRIHRSLLGVAILLPGLSAVSVILNWQEDEELHLYEHAETVRSRILRMLSDVESIESRHRGYLLTQRQEYLDNAEVKKKQLSSHIAELSKLTFVDPVQRQSVEELTQLVNLRLAEMKDTIALRKSKGLESAVEHLEGAQQTMDAIRHVAAEMSSEEKHAIAEKQQALRAWTTILWSVLIAQTAAGLALLGLAVKSLSNFVQVEKARTTELTNAKNRMEEALAAKTRFLATVSHEVRTPMAGVIGLAELLSLQDFGEEVNATIKALLLSARRLLQILNNLLDASRLESGKVNLEWRYFPSRSLVGDVIQLVRPAALQKKLEVRGFVDERIPLSLCGDEFRLRQVLTNLSFNAVKFTDEGEIQIRADLKEQTPEKTTVRFSVTDTGIGIAREKHKEIFEPFVQEHNSTSRVFGGTGLGLSISRQLVDLMGGELSLESEPGKGSKFWCDIPFPQGRCLP